MDVFVVPRAGKPFQFRNTGQKKVHRVPRMLDLDYEVLRAMQARIRAAEDPDDQAVIEAKEVFEAHAPGSTAGMSARQLGATVRAWMNEGGDEAGEAGSSSE